MSGFRVNQKLPCSEFLMILKLAQITIISIMILLDLISTINTY